MSIPESPAKALALVAKAKLVARAAAVAAKGGQGAARSGVSTAAAAGMQLVSEKAGNLSRLREAINGPRNALQALNSERSQAPTKEARAAVEQRMKPALDAYKTATKAATNGPKMARDAQKAISSTLAAVG